MRGKILIDSRGPAGCWPPLRAGRPGRAPHEGRLLGASRTKVPLRCGVRADDGESIRAEAQKIGKFGYDHWRALAATTAAYGGVDHGLRRPNADEAGRNQSTPDVSLITRNA